MLINTIIRDKYTVNIFSFACYLPNKRNPKRTFEAEIIHSNGMLYWYESATYYGLLKKVANKLK